MYNCAVCRQPDVRKCRAARCYPELGLHVTARGEVTGVAFCFGMKVALYCMCRGQRAGDLLLCALSFSSSHQHYDDMVMDSVSACRLHGINSTTSHIQVALYFNFDRTDSGFQERTYQEDQLAVLLHLGSYEGGNPICFCDNHFVRQALFFNVLR